MSEEKPEEIKPQKEKRRPIRKFFKSFINVRRWIFFDEVKSYGAFVVGLAKNVFFPQKKEHIKETFEEAVVRLNLTEQDLSNKRKYFFRSSVIYMFLGLALNCYAIYLFFDSHHIVATVVVILGLLMFVYSYRESFWLMQISRRKLGCTFGEWYQFILHRNSI